jgi:phenylalanine-4-hydroxylase
MFTTTSTSQTLSFNKDERMKKFKQIIEQIPPHLRQYIVEQDYSRYTPIEQATWRFTLRQLKSYLSKNAHECYIAGLSKTGIDTEAIPRIEVMCEKLQEFGWTAVPVSGFIPPAAFMELQSLNVLPIACDMRSIDHILYTPAPDIVHEAAGHAPILVDEQFASYLKAYAQVAKKAIISSEDLSQYEAIRDLSDIKEDPQSTEEQVRAAEEHLTKVNASISHVSEASLLGRMNWWTAEYGLIGDLQSPKIFGAGLLSSVGESRKCLLPSVKKIPLTIDCIDTSYDITEQQPQLFVAKSFADLSRVLGELEERLSFRRGGLYGLQTAIKAKTVNTVVLDSGLQISGVVSEVITDSDSNVVYYKLTGSTQLCELDVQLDGHDKNYHASGFSSPLGEYQPVDLKIGQAALLHFKSGVTVAGKVRSMLTSKNKTPMIISFDDCTVKYQGQTLFQPEWGIFDMAVGTKVVSVFAGPADRASYGMTDTFVKKVIPTKELSGESRQKNELYQKIRTLRESQSVSSKQLATLFHETHTYLPEQWLAFVELLELCDTDVDSDLCTLIETHLLDLQKKYPALQEYISLGLQLSDRIKL